MNQKEYFIIGCKLFGLYCLLVALNHIFKVVPEYFLYSGQVSDELYHILFITRISEIAKILIFLGLGIYLLKDGSIVHSLAYKDPVIENTLNFNVIFSLSLKLFGLFLIIKMLPYLLEVASNYIYYTNVPEYIDTDDSRRIVYIKTIPTFISFILGFYLLKGDNYFLRLGTKIKSKNKPTE